MFYPYGNPQSNQTLSWGAEPKYRGTYSILSSCIITIALCVWTAVHLNVPEHGRIMPQFWRKMSWMLVGLLAPELVAWTAFQQLQEAKRIRDDMRKLFGHPPVPSTISKTRHRLAIVVKWALTKSSETTTDDVDLEATDAQESEYAGRQPWTLTHGHYLAMGGFAVDVSDAPYIFPPGSPTTRFILQKGLEVLLRLIPDLVPDLTELEIKDKSKANGFAKTLVCLQAVWFCTQIIVRTASRLTISILELNTFAHALCTLLIYLLWWDKPLDITEPTIIHGEPAHPAIALLSVLQDSIKTTACVISPNSSHSENTQQNYHIKNHAITIKLFPEKKRYDYAPKGCRTKEDYNVDVPIPPGLTRVWLDELYPGTDFRVRQKRLDKPHLPDGSFAALDLPSDTAYRFKLARSAYDHFQGEREPETREFHKDYLTDRVKNTKLPDDEEDDGYWHFFVGITIAGVIYGGLHLTAWYAPISQTARTLWRVSGLIVALTGAMWLPFQVYIKLDNDRMNNRLPENGVVNFILKRYNRACERITLGYILLVAVVYVAARIYLIVECFLNVRRLPPSTFEVPTWSQYFPHIS
ncbi:hypothetical protein DE146DRAFT_789449 [Phaeosphaeria sp. MPI-PUGE-AT-0046c]|nr:hypothetical protein DE146DRAFT_789449 [Phaeosphaeria sp. MPI-PUGE-AT-0046c]